MSIKNAQKKLISTRDEIEVELAENPMIWLGIQTKLNQAIATLGFIGNLDVEFAKPVELPPVTEFMGEPLSRPEPVTEKTLTPSELERANLIAKIDTLEKSLPTITNDQILEAYKFDQTVIRGLAKRAGLEDFKTAQITEPYIQSVREAIELRRKNEEASAEFEETLTQN